MMTSNLKSFKKKCYPMAGDLQIQKLSQNVIQWLEISKLKSFHKMLFNCWRSASSKGFKKCYPMVGDLPYYTKKSIEKNHNYLTS
jgi:hypothetical protein